VEAAVEQALTDANRKRLSGSQITPYLLGRIRELTGGASLDMNIRLVKNNAVVGTAIAVALSRLGKASA
jgi:pseudouridine-5'-phosphate glycosidase